MSIEFVHPNTTLVQRN